MGRCPSRHPQTPLKRICSQTCSLETSRLSNPKCQLRLRLFEKPFFDSQKQLGFPVVYSIPSFRKNFERNSISVSLSWRSPPERLADAVIGGFQRLLYTEFVQGARRAGTSARRSGRIVRDRPKNSEKNAGIGESERGALAFSAPRGYNISWKLVPSCAEATGRRFDDVTRHSRRCIGRCRYTPERHGQMADEETHRANFSIARPAGSNGAARVL